MSKTKDSHNSTEKDKRKKKSSVIDVDNTIEEYKDEQMETYEGSGIIVDFSRPAENTEKKKKRRFFSPRKIIILILLIILIVFVVIDVKAGGVLASVSGNISAFFSQNSVENFSVAIDANTVYDFRAFDNGYAILTEEGIVYIDSSGDVSAKQQLTYSSSAMEISGNRVLIYDRGGTSYSLQRNKSLYAQQSTSDSIIDAAVSSNDNYAIAVKGDNAKTSLYGYDAQGNVIYQWDCPTGYITDVTLTSSGGKAAATVINSSNAVLSSYVYILDFDYDSAYAEFSYTDETVTGVTFVSSSKLIVVTDKNIYLIDKKEQSVIYDYNSSSVCYCDIGNGNITAVITTDHSSDESYTLAVVGKSGELLFTQELSGRVRGLSCSNKCTVVLFSDKIETYTKKGTLAGSVDGIKYFDGIVVSGNYVYVLSSENVKKYPAYGTVSYSETEEVETSA